MPTEQFAAIIAAAVTFLGSVIATVKWCVNRAAKAIDDSTAKHDKSIAAIAELRAAVIELRATIQEAREDVRELRAIFAHITPERPRESRPRLITNPTGVPLVRHPDDDP